MIRKAPKRGSSTAPRWKRPLFAALGVLVFALAVFLILVGVIGLSSCSQPGAGPAGGNNGSTGGSGKVIKTYAGTGSPGSTGDNASALKATLNTPMGLYVDKLGYVYIADAGNNEVRFVNLSGVIQPAAGEYSPGYTSDGVAPTSSKLYTPTAVTLDPSGNMYIADSFNSRVREVTGTISTYAGNGTPTFAGDTGLATAASVAFPSGVCFDAHGNCYIADSSNHRVRVVSASSLKITTYAGDGNSGSTGNNGPATSATLIDPYAVVMDSSGNLYISDSTANVVRKVNSSGTITTYAGTGTANYSGDNGPANQAALDGPAGLALDSSGNLYIADSYNNRIRMVNAGGIITTVAGNGTPGFSPDGTAATSASLLVPMGVAVDSSGTIYIADTGNSVVRTVK